MHKQAAAAQREPAASGQQEDDVQSDNDSDAPEPGPNGARMQVQTGTIGHELDLHVYTTRRFSDLCTLGKKE